jgi:outer membrane protein assembly factor BamA
MRWHLSSYKKSKQKKIQNMTLLLRGCAAALFCLVLFRQSAAHQDTIRNIYIYGNKVTGEKTVRLFLTADTGMVFDSARVAESKTWLMGTGLFSRVNIVVSHTAAGANIYVILEENQYITISDIGGELNSRKYGKPTDGWWWRARLGVRHTNFRGRMEQIGVSASIWESRSLSLSWNKPFLGTPWYIDLSAGVSYRPDLYMEFDRLNVYQTTIAGRKVGRHSRVYASLIPSYERKFWQGLPGYWEIDSTQAAASSIPAAPESTWISNAAIKHDVENDYSELYTGVGWAIDLRDRRFDAHNGMYASVFIKTNAAWPRFHDYRYAYVQMDTDTRLYYRGIISSHTIACRIRTTVRKDSAASYDGIYAGGESTLRGYSEGALPAGFIANNRLLGSAEYRFPVAQTPPMDYPFFSQFHAGLKNFYYRLDAAFIFDAAYVWHYISEPMHPDNKHVYGTGAGTGLRIMAPTLFHSICFDFVWGVDKRQRESLQKPWQPVFHMYLDLYY